MGNIVTGPFLPSPLYVNVTGEEENGKEIKQHNGGTGTGRIGRWKA